MPPDEYRPLSTAERSASYRRRMTERRADIRATLLRIMGAVEIGDARQLAEDLLKRLKPGAN